MLGLTTLRRPMSLAIALAVSVCVASCGSSSSSTTASSAASSGATSASASTTKKPLKSVIFVIAGDRSDGGYYQGQVEALQNAAKQYGFNLIVVDKVATPAAKTAFQSAVARNPSLIIGDYSLIQGFQAVCAQQQSSSIGFIGEAPISPQCKLASNVYMDNSQNHFLAGCAVGEYLKTSGKPSGTLATVAGPQLDFVVSDNDALKQGLKYCDPQANFRIVFTGDFDNAALATQATKAQIAQGANVIYSYLAGGLLPSMEAAKSAGVPILSNSLNGCLAPPSAGFKFIGSILNNPAAFWPNVIARYANGKLTPGTVTIYHVDYPGLGANICHATPAETKALEAARAALLSGKVTIQNDPYKGTTTTQ